MSYYRDDSADGLTCWLDELHLAIKNAHDDTALVAKAPDNDAVWLQRFDPGFGGNDGPPVLAWTEARVYFPVNYDGSEWLDSAPRNPQADGQPHVGGG